MKTKSIVALFILLGFFPGSGDAETTSSASSNEEAALYKYNLLEASTYSANSGFSSSTPVYWLWDGSTVQGVNDTKATGDVEAWIEFDFGKEESIAEANLFQDNGGNRVTHWKVMRWTGDKWEDVFPYVQSNTSGWQTQTFDIKATKIRFYAKCISNGYVSIHEIELYTKPSAEQKKVVIGCVGDSNTAGAGASEQALYSWPAQLGGILGAEYQVKNFGVSGTTLMKSPADSPWTNTTSYSNHKKSYSNISIIALGTNDSKSNNWTSTSPERFRTDYVGLIQEFQAYLSKPEVYMLMPIKAFSANHTINNTVIVGEIRPILRDISKTYGIAVIDGYVVTENIGALVPDGIHPNDAGLKKIAEKVASVLQTKKPVIVRDGEPSKTSYAEYRWYKDGVLIPQAVTSSYTTTQPGVYKVAVKPDAATDDIIVSNTIEISGSNIHLVVSDGLSASNQSATGVNVVRISNSLNKLLIENASGCDFTLFDVYGRVIKMATILNSYESIDITILSKGIYLYKVGNVKGKIIK